MVTPLEEGEVKAEGGADGMPPSCNSKRLDKEVQHNLQGCLQWPLLQCNHPSHTRASHPGPVGPVGHSSGANAGTACLGQRPRHQLGLHQNHLGKKVVVLYLMHRLSSRIATGTWRPTRLPPLPSQLTPRTPNNKQHGKSCGSNAPSAVALWSQNKARVCRCSPATFKAHKTGKG